MNTLMVLSDGTFPPDIRVEKEAKALINDGHRVFLLARNSGSQLKTEVINNVIIWRFSPILNNIPILKGIIYFSISRFLLLYKIIKLSIKYDIEILHVHDLPYGLATLVAGKIIGKPIIFDRHEDYPEMVISNQQSVISKILYIILKFEKAIMIRNASLIISVVEEAIVSQKEISNCERKMVVVSNTADIDNLRLLLDEKRPNQKKGLSTFEITYVGGFDNIRGLRTLIYGFEEVLRKHANGFHLNLIGDGEIKRDLTDLVEKLKIEDHVTFTGWLEFNKAMSYIIASDICTIPYEKTTFTDRTIPHKLFQYMYFGKPVLVSDVNPLKRIVGECNCGVVFKAGDPGDAARAIAYCYRNQDGLKEMGTRGKKKVLDQYNWGNEGKKLCEAYKRVYEGYK